MSKNTLDDISKILSDYKDVVLEDMQKAVDDTAKEAVTALRNVHLEKAEKYGSWRKYNRGWTSSKDTYGNKKTNRYKRLVHNKDKYRLAHLLEYGTKAHALPQGGRHPGSDEFPHIAEIDKKASENLLKRLQEKL